MAQDHHNDKNIFPSKLIDEMKLACFINRSCCAKFGKDLREIKRAGWQFKQILIVTFTELISIINVFIGVQLMRIFVRRVTIYDYVLRVHITRGFEINWLVIRTPLIERHIGD